MPVSARRFNRNRSFTLTEVGESNVEIHLHVIRSSYQLSGVSPNAMEGSLRTARCLTAIWRRIINSVDVNRSVKAVLHKSGVSVKAKRDMFYFIISRF